MIRLRYYWKQCFKATEEVQKINRVEGQGVVVNWTAQLLFKKLFQGDTSLKRRKDSSPIWQVNTEFISDLVNQNLMTWVRKVVNQLSIAKSTVFIHLKKTENCHTS